MTSPEERRREFLEDCVDVGEDERQGAVRIDDPTARRKEAERSRNQADLHRRAATDHVEGKAPLMTIREGYYAMMHATNEALTLAGFRIDTHHCTMMGLRGVFDEPDLADELRRAREERKNVDYRVDPADPTLENYAGAERFLRETVEPFREAIDDLIEDENLR